MNAPLPWIGQIKDSVKMQQFEVVFRKGILTSEYFLFWKAALYLPVSPLTISCIKVIIVS